VSSYAIDGFTNSIVEVFDVEGWFNSTMIPSASPLKLDTTTVNLLMPGISAYYGKDLPVNVHFKVQKLGDFTVKAAN